MTVEDFIKIILGFILTIGIPASILLLVFEYINVSSFFALIGVIFTLLVVLYLYNRSLQERQRRKETNEDDASWPPPEYMTAIGSKCPDYWINTGSDGNNDICKNNFNIPVNQENADKCYSNGNTMKFSKLHANRWPPKRGSLNDRCNWIKDCGPDSNTPGSWLGMNKFC